MKQCICCGKAVWNKEAIHTFMCISRHAKHVKGVNVSRCKTFGKKEGQDAKL